MPFRRILKKQQNPRSSHEIQKNTCNHQRRRGSLHGLVGLRLAVGIRSAVGAEDTVVYLQHAVALGYGGIVGQAGGIDDGIAHNQFAAVAHSSTGGGAADTVAIAAQADPGAVYFVSALALNKDTAGQAVTGFHTNGRSLVGLHAAAQQGR